jgi:glycerol kinase
MPFVLALDQGTTSTRSIVFDEAGEKRGVAQIALEQHFPRPGWVEHDALVIWRDQLATAREALAQAGLSAGDLSAIGVTNQRETVVIWDRATGEPIHNAIVWQDRRTAEWCDELAARGGVSDLVRERTGLTVDPYFSASKIGWLLDAVDGARARAESGELAAGTIDSWLVFKLSGGVLHVTDVTNASRTLLFDIAAGSWDRELCDLFGVPMALLPTVVRSSGVVGVTDPGVLGAPVPIAGICGDQQSSLVGNGGFSPGDAKVTFGTGIFALMHTGSERPRSETLAVTLAAQTTDSLEYALEGSIFMGGAVVQWVVEQLKLADSPAAAQALAESVPDSNGVVLVPALTGLGAPEWDPYARGAIFGLTRGANSAHIARAAMESIPLQVNDLIGAMVDDSGHALHLVRADGGVTVNTLVMQTLANVLSIPVHVAAMAESTALGAAFLAGRAVGVWSGPEDVPMLTRVGATYTPDADKASGIAHLRVLWSEAVKRSLRWERDE